MNQPSMRVMSKEYMLAHAGECVKISDDGLSFEAVECGGGTSYLVYAAFLNSTGSGDPTPTVKTNTLGGTVVWTRGSEGYYVGTLAGAFTLNKTAIILGAPSGFVFLAGGNDNEPDSVFVTQANPAGMEVDQLNNQFVEIRVYP